MTSKLFLLVSSFWHLVGTSMSEYLQFLHPPIYTLTVLSLWADCSSPTLEFGLGHRTLFVSWHVVRLNSVPFLSLVLKRAYVSTDLVDLCHHHEKNNPGLLASARCIKQTCSRYHRSCQSMRISDWCVSHWDFGGLHVTQHYCWPIQELSDGPKLVFERVIYKMLDLGFIYCHCLQF